MPRTVKKHARPKPLVLIVLEGWGVGPAHAGNAISEADPAYFKYLLSHYPALTLEGSGTAVGLIPGHEVTSEDGYALIGGGRPCLDTRRLIDERIADSSFSQSPELSAAMQRAQNGKLHLVGLLSPADQEASLSHLEALVDLAERSGVTRIFLHAILDGRDAPNTAAKNLVLAWEERLAKKGGGIASLSGRFYAMDPYRQAARIEKAADAISKGAGNLAVSVQDVIEETYAKKIYDEEFPATVISDGAGTPRAPLAPEDAVILFNFKTLSSQALAERLMASSAAAFFSLADYMLEHNPEPAFRVPDSLPTLGSAISAAGLSQLRLSDSEGFSGITTFLNGGSEAPLPGEERKIIPVPLLEDYAEQPELANEEIAKEAVKAIEEKKYDFIAISFASIDRLAHSANLDATVKTIKSVDAALERIITAALAAGGGAVVTSTHGLAEQTISHTDENFASHTGRIVPLLLIGKEVEGFSLGYQQPIDSDLSPLPPAGTLSDVAPTVLRFMRLPVPPEMSGKSFFDPKHLV